MPGHLKSVMIVGMLLVPLGLSAQDMGGENSPMMDTDTTTHGMPSASN